MDTLATPLSSIRAALLDDPAFKAWHDEVTRGGTRVSPTPVRPSPPVRVKNLIVSAGITREDLDTNPPQPPPVPGILRYVSQGTTTSDTVHWTGVTGGTNNAAPWPEPTSAATATAKPESSMATTGGDTPVVTIPTWMSATRNAMANADDLASMIEDELKRFVLDRLAVEVIAGNGGASVIGIVNTPGLTQQAFATSVLSTLRAALATAQTHGTPNAYLLNPADAAAADNAVLAAGAMPSGSLFGLPVVAHPAVPASTAFVGDFTVAKLWMREDAVVYISDSHADWFIKNLTVLLAEVRAAFRVRRPPAIVRAALV